MRADRLLSILSLLQVHRRLTSRELAARLEVSERTIHRDMDVLSGMGVPIYAQRGAGGGWILSEPYRTDLTGLSGGEIRALFLGTPAHLLADLGLRQAAEAALVKLLASLPSARRRDAEYVRRRIHVDAAGWDRPEEAVPALPAVQEAVWTERKLALSYRRSDGTTVGRLIDPLGLVAKGSIWYLIAAVAGELRTYRVSRIQAAALTDEPVSRPPDFDLAATWAALSAGFKAALPRYPVTLRVAPEILPRIRQGIRYARVEEEEAPGEDGWVPVRIQFEVEREACECVLSLGSNVEVLEPVELRERVIRAGQEIVVLYRERHLSGW